MATYAINGIVFSTQPTSGKWSKRDTLGIDGNGHPIYPTFREFEMTWSLIDEAEFYELQTFFDTLIVTGTCVVTLPQYKYNSTTDWLFYAYSGCVIQEPVSNEFFEQHRTSVSLLITHIKT